MVPIESSKCIFCSENFTDTLSLLMYSFSSSVNICLNNSSSGSVVFLPLKTYIVSIFPFTSFFILYILVSKDSFFDVCDEFIDDDFDIYINLLLFLIYYISKILN